MLGKIYTKAGEENFIANIIKNSLAVDVPKYVILRMAINKSFRLEYKSLDNPCYANFILYDGFSSGGGEYNMSQVTGSGKESKDYTDILRTAFMLRHKSENLDFSDDAIFISAIEKYIHRGLYELNNLYKSKDDFYQFLIDEFSVTIEPKILPTEESISERLDEDKIREYFTSAGIKAEILSSDYALRHDAFKIRFKDMKDYARVENEVDDYKVKFGLYSDASTQYAGEQMSLNLYLPRPKSQWKKFDADDFGFDISSYTKSYALPAYCGRNIKNEAFFFDLSQHLLIGGTSGSGKSMLLHTLITSLAMLNQNIRFVLIDPKNGAEFGIYDKLRSLSELGGVVKDISHTQTVIDAVIKEMDRRYSVLAKEGVSKNAELPTPMPSMVVVFDEVADAFGQIKTLQDSIVILAQKARAADIHLIIATQTPNANIFKQELRANFDLRIALKVQNAKASRIVLDESGAEKLLGAGDMLVKLSGSQPQHIFAPYLSKGDIKRLLELK